MGAFQQYVLVPKGASEFFAVLGTSENGYDELHGTFTSKQSAFYRAGALAREYSDYTTLEVVKVEIVRLEIPAKEKK